MLKCKATIKMYKKKVSTQAEVGTNLLSDELESTQSNYCHFSN